MDEAYRKGIVHRDIKPDNIMIDEAGRVKVMDFWLARATTATTKLTAEGAYLGTPMHMSPEQISGDPIDARTDIYSLVRPRSSVSDGRLRRDRA